MSHASPAYGPLVEVCRAHGIGKTTAFELANKGLLKTFRLGVKRYVTLESVNELPSRIAAAKSQGA